MNYYQQQFELLNKPSSTVKIQLSGLNYDNESVNTNWIDLNHESIQALRDFLDTVESEIY